MFELPYPVFEGGDGKVCEIIDGGAKISDRDMEEVMCRPWASRMQREYILKDMTERNLDETASRPDGQPERHGVGADGLSGDEFGSLIEPFSDMLVSMPGQTESSRPAGAFAGDGDSVAREALGASIRKGVPSLVESIGTKDDVAREDDDDPKPPGT